MAKSRQNIKHSRRSIVGLAVLLLGLSVGLVAMAKGVDFKRSNAANPLSVTPCSGNWNYTDCFVVKNPSRAPIRFAYFIECYDKTYCENVNAITTLQPGRSIVLGQPNGCSKWQLDFNWSSPDTSSAKGVWQSGFVVEKKADAVCNCNYTELNIMPAK